MAIVAGVGVWVVAWAVGGDFFPGTPLGNYALLASVILWQPMLEELLFRGVIQGQVAQKKWGKPVCCGVSGANLVATILFALSHLVYHTPIWAIAVVAPSLVFGHFRDRYKSVWPGLALHVFYNAGYFLIGAVIHKG